MRPIFALMSLAALVLLIPGCRRAEPIPAISLPPTSVLSTRSNYAVVTENLLRVRDKPGKDATVILHIRRGNVVEVVSRTETMEEVEGVLGYWYLVDYSGLKGWVFGAYLRIAGSRSEAERLSGTLE
jgi:uncharacterized protein YgiM (DUF1202 family)